MEESKQTQPEFCSISELAKRGGVCYRTILRAVKAKKIKAVTFGGAWRIPAKEADRIMQHGWR